jgi:hypothetical protein
MALPIGGRLISSVFFLFMLLTYVLYCGILYVINLLFTTGGHMLQSKYLTQDGITGFLQMIYDRGYNFVFYNPDRGQYVLSEKEPVFRENTFLRCDGDYKFASDVLGHLNESEVLQVLDQIASIVEDEDGEWVYGHE